MAGHLSPRRPKGERLFTDEEGNRYALRIGKFDVTFMVGLDKPACIPLSEVREDQYALPEELWATDEVDNILREKDYANIEVPPKKTSLGED